MRSVILAASAAVALGVAGCGSTSKSQPVTGAQATSATGTTTTAANDSHLTVEPSVVHLDTAGSTVTLPLHEGLTAAGKPAWYIVTDSSDAADAKARGVNYAKKLANALGTKAVKRSRARKARSSFPGPCSSGSRTSSSRAPKASRPPSRHRARRRREVQPADRHRPRGRDRRAASCQRERPEQLRDEHRLQGAHGDDQTARRLGRRRAQLLPANGRFGAAACGDRVEHVGAQPQRCAGSGVGERRQLIAFGDHSDRQRAARVRRREQACRGWPPHCLARARRRTSSRTRPTPRRTPRYGTFRRPSGTKAAIAAHKRVRLTSAKDVAEGIRDGSLTSGGTGPANSSLGGLKAAEFISNCSIVAIG